MNAMYEMECNVREQNSDKQAEYGFVFNAGDLELDVLVNWKPVVMFEQSRWAGWLTVGAPGDNPGDGVLCTLQTSDVFRHLNNMCLLTEGWLGWVVVGGFLIEYQDGIDLWKVTHPILAGCLMRTNFIEQ